MTIKVLSIGAVFCKVFHEDWDWNLRSGFQAVGPLKSLRLSFVLRILRSMLPIGFNPSFACGDLSFLSGRLDLLSFEVLAQTWVMLYHSNYISNFENSSSTLCQSPIRLFSCPVPRALASVSQNACFHDLNHLQIQYPTQIQNARLDDDLKKQTLTDETAFFESQGSYHS